MAKKQGELNVKITAKVKGFVGAINKLNKRIKKFQRTATNAGNTLTTRVTLPLIAAGGVAIRMAAKFETLRVQLDVLSGSAEAGGRAFNRLIEFSKKTPFQLDQLVSTNNQLIGFGFNAEQAYASTRRLADVAALTNANMTNLAFAFGQAAAEGKALTRDIRQFITNNVPILDLLAETMGRNRNEILGLAEDGKITFQVLNEAFIKATEEGGKFHNGTKILSETLNGLYTTLKDNVSIALAKMGDSIVKATSLKEKIKQLGAGINNLADRFDDLTQAQKLSLLKTALMLILAGPLLILVGQLSSAVLLLTGGLKQVASAVGFLLAPANALLAVLVALAAAFIYLEQNSAQFRAMLGGVKSVSKEIQAEISKNYYGQGPFGTLQGAISYFSTGKAKEDYQKGVEGTVLDDKGSYFDRLTANITNFKNFVEGSFKGLDFGAALEGIGDIDFTNLYGTTGGSGGDKTVLDGRPLANMLKMLLDLRGKLKETDAYVLEFAQNTGNNVEALFGNIINSIVGLAKHTQETLTGTVKFVVGNFDLILSTTQGIFTDIFDTIASGGENAIATLTRTIGALVKKLIVAAAAAFFLSTLLPGLGVKDVGGVVTDFNGLFSALSGINIASNAKGGFTTGPVLSMLGDNPKGQEAVVPFERMGEFLKMAAPYVPGGGAGGQVVFRVAGQDLIGVLVNSRDSYGYVNGVSPI